MQMADPLLEHGSPSNVATRTAVSQEESNERQKEVGDSRERENERTSLEERETSQLSNIAYDKVDNVKDTEGKS